MSIREWLVKNIDKYDNWGEWISDCVKELGVTRRAVKKQSWRYWKAYAGKVKLDSNELAEIKPDAQPHIQKSMNRVQFLSRYDINTKTRDAIRQGVQTLKESEMPEEDEILEDADFRLDRCGNVNLQVYRKIANETEFSKFQFNVADKVFWTTIRQRNWAIENVPRAKEV